MSAIRKNDISLNIGTLLTTGKTRFFVDSMSGDQFVLREVENNQKKLIAKSDLLVAIISGSVKVVDHEHEVKENDNYTLLKVSDVLSHLPIADLSDAQREHVLKVLRYVSALRKNGYSSMHCSSPFFQRDINKLALQMRDSKPPKASWLYKWSLKLDAANGDARSIIPRFDKRGGHNKSRLDDPVRKAIDDAILQHEQNPASRLRVVDIQKTATKILISGDRTSAATDVSWSTVDRSIKEKIPAYTLCVRRKGKAYAERLYREWYPRDRAQYALEVVETDDTDTGIFLIDSETGLPYGRGYLTSVVDQFSAAVLGWELSEKPRSLWSAFSSIVNSILPSNTSLPEFACCSEPTEFFGRPGTVIFDNALYNHAAAIEVGAAECGYGVGWAQPYTPPQKSVIENFNGVVKQNALCELPGWRGDKTRKEGLKEGMSSANMTLADFRAFFAKWVSDIYSNSPGDCGLTPRQRWHQSMRDIAPRIPRDIRGLKITACIPTTIKLRPEGIQFTRLIYSNPALQVMRKKYGHNVEVKIKYNPADVGEIYVFEPQLKQYFPVLATNEEYARGLSLYQHKLILKLARENKIRNPEIPDLLLHREELRKITSRLRYSKKISERKRAARTGEIPNPEPVALASQTSIETSVVAQTELEYLVSEIEKIEIDSSDEELEISCDF